MKKATYTSGPWSIDAFGVVVGSKGEFIAEIFGPDEDNFELIVSAPDLYEALEIVIGCSDHQNPEVWEAALKCGLEALEKARGKG